MNKTANKVLGKVRKDRASTIQSVAKAAGVDYQAARYHLIKLAEAGSVALVGNKTTGKRGRPAQLYKKVA